MIHRFPPGQVCVQHVGSQFWPTIQAVHAWQDYSDVSAVVRTSCAGYPATRIMVVRAYNASDWACAKTGPDHYQWSGTHWWPVGMTMWINTRYPVCYDSYKRRAGVVSHEFGHAWGLGCGNLPGGYAGAGMYWGASIMGDGGNETWPTYLDRVRVGVLYPDGQ